MAELYELGSGLVRTLELEKRKLIIKEDICFIQSLASLRAPSKKESPHLFMNVFTLIAGGIFGACVAIKYSAYGIVLMSLFCSLSFFLITHLSKKILIRALSLCVNYKFEYEVSQLYYKKMVLSKFLKSTEEAVLIQSKSKCGFKAENMCMVLVSNCRKIFTELRFRALKLENSYSILPTNDENDSTSLCNLPLDTFENLLSETQVLNMSQLKSLVQLIRLQQSEFLKNIFCILILNQTKGLIDVLHIFWNIFNILSTLRLNTNVHFDDLKLHNYYYDSLWLSESTKSISKNSNKLDDTAYFVNNAKIELKSALLILEEISDNRSTEEIIFENGINEVLTLLTNTSGSLQTTLKIISRGKKSTKTPCEVSPNSLEKEDKISPVIESENAVNVDYQVFEAIIPYEKVDITKESTSEIVELDQRQIGMSVNLNEELKIALLCKAKEHREREAKALGVSIDSIPIQLLEQRDTSSLNDKNKTDIRENLAETYFISQPSDITFSKLLAEVAAKRCMDIKSAKEEETFGDSDSSDDSQDNNRMFK